MAQTAQKPQELPPANERLIHHLTQSVDLLRSHCELSLLVPQDKVFQYTETERVISLMGDLLRAYGAAMKRAVR